MLLKPGDVGSSPAGRARRRTLRSGRSPAARSASWVRRRADRAPRFPRGGTSRSSLVVMNRTGRGAILSTTHSGMKPSVSSTNSSGISLRRRDCRVAPPRRVRRTAGRAAGSRSGRRIPTAHHHALARDRRRSGQQVVEFVRPAHAAHPAPTVADADHRDDAFHARIDRADPDHRGAAIARAVDAQPLRIHLGCAASHVSADCEFITRPYGARRLRGPSLSPQPL